MRKLFLTAILICFSATVMAMPPNFLQSVIGKKQSYMGIWHAIPTGICYAEDDCVCTDDDYDEIWDIWNFIRARYQYAAFYHLDDGSTYYGMLLINANDWVALDAASVATIINDRGSIINGNIYTGYQTDPTRIAAAIHSNGFADFHHYYESAQYGYEYGKICQWKSGSDYSRLWVLDSESYCYITVHGTVKTASFTMIWEDGANMVFNLSRGKRVGNYFYADYVYDLGHNGVWNLSLINGNPLKWRFNISTGQMIQWHAGSEGNPDETFSFNVVSGNTGSPSFPICNCSEPGSECECIYCRTHTPCENMPPN